MMTVIFIEALLPEPSCVAQVIVVVPALRAVTLPLWSTLAIVGLLLDQTGGNAGGDLVFPTFSDTGAYLRNNLTLRRSDGLATFAAGVTAGGFYPVWRGGDDPGVSQAIAVGPAFDDFAGKRAGDVERPRVLVACDAVAKMAQPVNGDDHSAASASSSSTPMKPPDCRFQYRA